MSQSILSSHQPSLTEWFAAIGNEEAAAAMREEDNMRNSRWEILYKLIGFPYDRPEIFKATELVTPVPAFQKLLAERGDLPAAIRLIPLREGLPKLRTRGLPLRESYEKWFLQQEFNPDEYLAEVYRHHENKSWSTTFIIHQNGITGELIEGLHNQLTQGNTLNQLYQFQFDFKNWVWSADPGEGATTIEKIVNHIKVADSKIQEELANQLQAEFYNNYLGGYFEATVLDTGEAFFIDYNRLLGRTITASVNFIQPSTTSTPPDTLRGAPAFPGKVTGRVCVVDVEKDASVDFHDGDILVCANTDVRYLLYMRRAGAIVTDHGSILSHAAIVARELKKPCIVNTREATKKLRTGDAVEV